MRRFALATLVLLVLVSSVSAQGRRERRSSRNRGWSPQWTEVASGTIMTIDPPKVSAGPALPDGPPPVITDTKPADHSGSSDAMDEVNAKRAQKGLPPLQKDPLLCQAAFACAKQRAARNIHGHLESDFAYLPSGAHASVAGCGALEDSWGWETCAYDSSQYRVGGAAWVRGPGGLRFMHFFGR